MSFLPSEDLAKVILLAPLISIDLIITNSKNEMLLGERINRPAVGYWFVPGGRILKNETIEYAFRRVSKAELGVQIELDAASFSGVFQHFYEDNTYDESFGTHYVALAYRITLDLPLQNIPKSQHNAFQWWNLADLASANKVHAYTKQYIVANRLD